MSLLAAHTWPTNGHLIEDLATVGYLHVDDLTLDPTYGRGVWWRRWRPRFLCAHDINPAKAPDGPMDFRALDYPDRCFDVVVFDPPYMAPGGRERSTISTFNDQYGLHAAAARPDTNQLLINAGLSECERVTRKGGLVLVKCMDYINAKAYWPGTHHTLTHALDIGLRIEERAEHIRKKSGRLSPNPDGTPRRQIHLRRNLTTLFIFKVPHR